MKTIMFHNELKELYPTGIKLHGDTAEECLSGLRNYPGLRDGEGSFQVFLPDFQSYDAMRTPTTRDVIHVHPVMAGAGGKPGWMQIAIGVLMVVTAPAGGLFVGTAFAMSQGAIVAAGVMMALGGIVALLTPSPKSSAGGADNSKSEYMAANKNTTKAGTRIALVLGRAKVYGHFLSFQITASNYGEMPAIPPIETPGGVEMRGDGNYLISTTDWSI